MIAGEKVCIQTAYILLQKNLENLSSEYLILSHSVAELSVQKWQRPVRMEYNSSQILKSYKLLKKLATNLLSTCFPQENYGNLSK